MRATGERVVTCPPELPVAAISATCPGWIKVRDREPQLRGRDGAGVQGPTFTDQRGCRVFGPCSAETDALPRQCGRSVRAVDPRGCAGVGAAWGSAGPLQLRRGEPRQLRADRAGPAAGRLACLRGAAGSMW